MPAPCSAHPDALVRMLLESLDTTSLRPGSFMPQGLVTPRRLSLVSFGSTFFRAAWPGGRGPDQPTHRRALDPCYQTP